MMLEWNNDSFSLSGVGTLHAEWLRRLPGCALAEDDSARARIFPAPTGGKDAEFDSEWREYVEPSLQELFASHIEVVSADLKVLAPGKPGSGEPDFEQLIESETEDGGQTIAIPASHAKAWMHTLNQARLALGARHGLEEKHMNGNVFPEDPHDVFAVFQVEFYGVLLSFLLQHTEL